MLWASLLTPNGLKLNMEPNKQPANEQKCDAKEECLRELDDLGPNLFPVCPAFRPASTLSAETVTCTPPPFEYQEPAKLLHGASQGNSDADCMERVCRVLQYLARPLSCDVLVECAHRWNIVGESLDPIREDLNTLPKRLERLQKDYRETPGKCIRWLRRLADAESNYALALKEKRRLVYLVPDPVQTLPGISSFLAHKPKPLDGFENVPYPPESLPVVGYTCAEYLSYQEQIVPNLADYLKYYPADAVEIAEVLAAELSGLRGALEMTDHELNVQGQPNRTPGSQKIVGATEIQQKIDLAIRLIEQLNREKERHARRRKKLLDNESLDQPLAVRNEYLERKWQRNAAPLIGDIQRLLGELRPYIRAHWSDSSEEQGWDIFFDMIDCGKDDYERWKASGWADIHIQELRRVVAALVGLRAQSGQRPNEQGQSRGPSSGNGQTIERSGPAGPATQADGIQHIEHDINEAESLLRELVDGKLSVEKRRATYERLRDEARPGLERAYWAINGESTENGPDASREAMQKNPALARIYNRLRFHLGYDMLGNTPEGNRLAIELERVETHLEHLEKLRFRVRDLVELADEILEFPPKIDALQKWRKDLQQWAEADKPNDYRPKDGTNLGLLLGPRGGVAIENLLGKPFERVFRKLESLKDKTIDGLSVSLRAGRDEILQEIDSLKAEAVGGPAKPGKLLSMDSPGTCDRRPSGWGKLSPTAGGSSHVEGVMTEASNSQYLSSVRGLVDTMLYGTVRTYAGGTVRVDPQQVKERFKGCVSVFLAAWLHWHDSHKNEPLTLPANPINWPKDTTGIFTEIKDACFYTTLAVIHDSIASAIEPNGRIIDPKMEGWKGLKSVLYHHCMLGQDQQAGYTRELIDEAVRVVQNDLIQHCRLPAEQQNDAGKVIRQEERLNGRLIDDEQDKTSNTLEEGSGFWTITFQGKKLPPMQGREAFAYLAYLLTHPREWISAIRVIEAAHEARSAQQRRPPEIADQEDVGEEESPSRKKGIKYRESEDMADRTYMERCHEKLSSLRAEQQQARDNGDAASADRCQQEFDAIVDTLKGLTGPGGRFQKFTNEVDNAYHAVWKARGRVLRKVAGHSPELLQHLKNCIHFDKPCISYQPETPTEWH